MYVLERIQESYWTLSQSADVPARVKAFQDRKPELTTRLDLARAHLGMTPPGYTSAEVELSSVDRICKAAEKKVRAEPGGPVGATIVTPDDADGAAAPRGPDQLGNQDLGVMETLADIRQLRVEALELLVEVEDGLGREARAQRCRELLRDLR